MANNTPSSGRNGSVLNIGIGMLIGLVVALVVAAFAMSGGPFREKANTNTLTPTTGSTDPNAPLYGNQTNTQLPTQPNNAPPANEQGTGTGALTGEPPASTGLSKNPSDADLKDNSIATPPAAPVAKAKKSNSDDPIGDLINNKPATEKKPLIEKTKPTTENNEAVSKAATMTPKTTTTTTTTATPKTVTTTTAPKTTTTTPKTTKPAVTKSDVPKTVNPVTAP